MGGIWGLSASTALENMPVAARGLISGVLQQGYAVGYLIAAVVNLGLVPHNPHTWRALFWFGSAVSFVAAVLRSVLPESAVFLRAKAARKAAEEREGYQAGPSKTKVFLHETKQMLKTHWLLCIYAVLLMTGFNFLSHGSQDLYPTYLQKTKLLTAHQSTIATIIGNCGAIAGGVVAGYVSQHIGRRLTIIIFVCLVGAFIPLWILPDGFGKLAAGAFCVQFGVQGAWGVVPIFLAEMSPPAFRATFPGVAYQLGNGIFLGVVAAYLITVTIFGPEHHGSEFEKHKTAFEEGGGEDDAYVREEVLPSSHAHGIEEGMREKEKNRDSGSFDENPKPEVQTVEKV
ncbi:hypothetical protein FRC07_000051 [Ceratobasidium sp. 392]|nr:hypothetical protein FRC07_000051 [Ceratobasidium sp. 392]